MPYKDPINAKLHQQEVHHREKLLARAGRACDRCNTGLSIYNSETLCACCQRKVRRIPRRISIGGY